MNNVQIFAAPLGHRGAVAVAGEDRTGFLQGLISQDIEKVDAAHAAYGALLTPQGKFLHEFCIVARDADFLLECERDRAADLVQRLSRFRLRAKIELADLSERIGVVAVFSPAAPEHAPALFGLDAEPGAAKAIEGGIAFTDPRHAGLGCRAILAPGAVPAGTIPATLEDYDCWRLELGIGDGARDLEIDKTTLLEANFDALNGLDWDKGCYVGQEVTARMRYRGLVKRRLVPVRFDGPAPAPGASVMSDGKAVGKMRSAAGGLGLADLRLDAAGETDLTVDGAPLTALIPDWLAPALDDG